MIPDTAPKICPAVRPSSEAFEAAVAAAAAAGVT